jgi:hypothetical protein
MYVGIAPGMYVGWVGGRMQARVGRTQLDEQAGPECNPDASRLGLHMHWSQQAGCSSR